MKMTILVGKSELAEEKEKKKFFFPGIFLVIAIILKQLKL